MNLSISSKRIAWYLVYVGKIKETSSKEGVKTHALAYLITLCIVLLLLASSTAYLHLFVGLLSKKHAVAYWILNGGYWILFIVAFLLLRKIPRKKVGALIIGGAVLIGLASLTSVPNISTDSARYAWDGIVQDNGISPYQYAPVDTALKELRPQWLFPHVTSKISDGVNATCPTTTAFSTAQVGSSTSLICTEINRGQVITIYPPFAEILFAVIRLPFAASVTYFPLQFFGFLCVVGTSLLLLYGLSKRNRDTRWAALWAWCPLVATEGINNSHIDVAAALFSLLAILLVTSGKPIRGSIVLGLAIATKFTPALFAAPLVKKNPVKIIGVAVGTVALLYVPYIFASGAGVLGFLPGYLSEEGYENGSRSVLLSIFLPDSLTTLVAALILLIVIVLAIWRSNPQNPWVGQLVIFGTALLLLSPRYEWYCLVLIPFIAMTGRWEWLALPLAFNLRQLVFSKPWEFQLEILGAVLVVVVGSLIRLLLDRRGDSANITSEPERISATL